MGKKYESDQPNERPNDIQQARTQKSGLKDDEPRQGPPPDYKAKVDEDEIESDYADDEESE